MTDPRPDHIMQVGIGFWASKILLSAVEMQVFTELAKHPEPLAELGARLGLHPRSARDFLDALVALGFLERKDGVYSNSPETDFFLDKNKPSYIGGILESCECDCDLVLLGGEFLSGRLLGVCGIKAAHF